MSDTRTMTSRPKLMLHPSAAAMIRELDGYAWHAPTRTSASLDPDPGCLDPRLETMICALRRTVADLSDSAGV